jgi:hypothetical protein
LLNIFFNPQVKQTNNIDKRQANTSRVSFCGTEDSFVKTSDTQAEFEKDAKLYTEQMLETAQGSSLLLKKLKKSDVNAIELNKLAEKYKKTLSLEDKKALLKHEEKILWQELEKPEIGVFRNIKEMKNARMNLKPSEIIPVIKLSALMGLSRMRQAYDDLDIKFEDGAKKLEILQNVIRNTPDDSLYAFKIKERSLNNALGVSPDRTQLCDFLNYVIKNETNDKIKNRAEKYLYGRKYDETKLIESLNNDQIIIDQKKSIIKTLGMNYSEKLKEILPQIIKNENTDKDIKTAAIWAAGRCQSQKAFDLLYKITNNKDEKNPEQREMALHSLALYVKNNKDQVKQTLHNVIAEKSDLSKLAQILLEKVEGRFNEKDHELDHLGFSEEDKKKFEESRKEYIQTHDDNLNIQQTNWVDRALAPLAAALEKIAQNGSKAHIQKDTYTLIFPENAGKRNFVQNVEYGGDFNDSIMSANLSGPGMPSKIIVNENRLKLKTKANILAHEFNHNFLHDLLNKEDTKTLNELYEKAKAGEKCLDDYAALNVYEYFAQGYEAYCTVYKPHSAMIDNDDYVLGGRCHVQSTLKRKDPELYDFIEHCIKKYNKKPELSALSLRGA